MNGIISLYWHVYILLYFLLVSKMLVMYLPCNSWSTISWQEGPTTLISRYRLVVIVRLETRPEHPTRATRTCTECSSRSKEMNCQGTSIPFGSP